MPRKPPFRYQLTGTAVPHQGSAAASFNGPAVPLRGRHISLEIAWDGTVAGTLKLQHTFDGVNYRDTPGAAAEFTANGNAQPAGSPGNMCVNFEEVPGTACRFVFTRSGGTGTITSYVSQGE